MGHTPYGYRTENGKAVIDEEKAQQIRNLYRNYLDGMALAKAAHEAGIETWHGSAKRLLENKHYLGDDYYPAIIDQQTYDRAQAERLRRAKVLGRTNRKPATKRRSPTTRNTSKATRNGNSPESSPTTESAAPTQRSVMNSTA